MDGTTRDIDRSGLIINDLPTAERFKKAEVRLMHIYMPRELLTCQQETDEQDCDIACTFEPLYRRKLNGFNLKIAHRQGSK